MLNFKSKVLNDPTGSGATHPVFEVGAT